MPSEVEIIAPLEVRGGDLELPIDLDVEVDQQSALHHDGDREIDVAGNSMGKGTRRGNGGRRDEEGNSQCCQEQGEGREGHDTREEHTAPIMFIDVRLLAEAGIEGVVPEGRSIVGSTAREIKEGFAPPH